MASGQTEGETQWRSVIDALTKALMQYKEAGKVESAEYLAFVETAELFVLQFLTAAIGIWFGWIMPYLSRLEQVRFELRNLDT